MKKPPVATCWRVLIQEPTQNIISGNYGALEKNVEDCFERGSVFDELAICFAPDPDQNKPPFTQHNATTLHLEQMNARDWLLAIGDYKFNIHVGKDGALELMQQDGPDVEDGR